MQPERAQNGQLPWGEKRVLFVSGKGGVGKSLAALAIAHDLALAGKRVLLAEIGESSYFKDFCNLPQVGHIPVKTPMGFDVALWSGESSLHEYVLHYLKMERLYRLFFENKVMRTLINVAPGLREIAIVGKITSGIRHVGPSMTYDTVVVDCYATGHALALLKSPRGMMEAIQFGPMGAQSREIEAVLRNPKLCGYIAVTLLEELPVTETLEFCQSIKSEFGIPAEIIINKVLHSPVADSAFRELASIKDSDHQAVAEFARHIEAVLLRQQQMVDVLNKNVNGRRLFEIPLIFSSDPQQLIARAGEALRKKA